MLYNLFNNDIIVMCIFEQMKVLKENIAKVHDPALLFAMNKKYNELKEEAKRIKSVTIYK